MASVVGGDGGWIGLASPRTSCPGRGSSTSLVPAGANASLICSSVPGWCRHCCAPGKERVVLQLQKTLQDQLAPHAWRPTCALAQQHRPGTPLCLEASLAHKAALLPCQEAAGPGSGGVTDGWGGGKARVGRTLMGGGGELYTGNRVKQGSKGWQAGRQAGAGAGSTAALPRL